MPQSELTPDEVTAVRSLLEQVGTVRPLIIEHIRSKGLMKKFVKGKMDCPICEDGTVHYTRAGHYNGHVSAQCTTENCVNWIE